MQQYLNVETVLLQLGGSELEVFLVGCFHVFEDSLVLLRCKFVHDV